MKKSYNDEKYKGISEILKELPKINAPDNFEFNLRTRIENKNFGNLIEEKQKLGLFWKLTPSLAITVSAVILFFVFNDQITEIENPLMVMPQEIVMTESTPLSVIESSDALKSSPPPSPEVESSGMSSEEELYRVVVRSNDVVSNEKITLNLETGNNVDLDSYLNGDSNGSVRSSRSRLVGAGETFEFNGFYIREQTDHKLLEAIKSRIDSVNDARNDSLSGSQNIPE